MACKKAIVTQYRAMTNTRGARIVAKDGDGNRAYIGYEELTNHEFGEPRHRAAALALCAKMNWNAANLVGGWLSNDSYVFVFND